jgi:hypothetical protein
MYIDPFYFIYMYNTVLIFCSQSLLFRIFHSDISIVVATAPKGRVGSGAEHNEMKI